MNIKEYLYKAEKYSGFKPSGVDKTLYLDIIERVVDGYGLDYFEKMIGGKEPFVICIGLRAAGAIAFLISNGRKADWFDMWKRLMDASCDALLSKSDFAENDLSVKEIILALKLMKGKVCQSLYLRWYEKLKLIDPYVTYNCNYSETKKYDRMCNMTVYNMAGEYLRETEGMTDTAEYFKMHWPWVIGRFDENGMYVDPDHAMLYDLTTRCQIAVMLWFGYNGKYRDILDRNLKNAGLMTLFMQSSAFQLPYGGRSNQYIFNEALVAACCEYEAARYKKEGDAKTAGMFKRCARMSARTILRWLNAMEHPKHNKNFYPHDSEFGIDGYGTYYRYLITLASFLQYAYLYAEDDIEEYPCPAEMGGYVLETSKDFHKVFANCKGNSIEIETAADSNYDSTGMGRYHKDGVSIELGLSMPLTVLPRYRLPDELARRNLSICTGWEAPDGDTLYISEFGNKLDSSIKIIEESAEKVVFSVEYSGDVIKGCKRIEEKFTLDSRGVLIESKLIDPDCNKIFFTVPLFETNGKDKSLIKYSKSSIAISMEDFSYIISSEGYIEAGKDRYGNRNGIYRAAVVSKEGTNLAVRLKLYKLK